MLKDCSEMKDGGEERGQWVAGRSGVGQSGLEKEGGVGRVWRHDDGHCHL